MVQYDAITARLDLAFAALADPVRREVIWQLGDGDASLSELAVAHGMTLTGMQKHVGVLERAGMVMTRKQGRVRRCALQPGALALEAAWLGIMRERFEARFAALDAVLAELQQGKDHE